MHSIVDKDLDRDLNLEVVDGEERPGKSLRTKWEDEGLERSEFGSTTRLMFTAGALVKV